MVDWSPVDYSLDSCSVHFAPFVAVLPPSFGRYGPTELEADGFGPSPIEVK